MFQRASYTDGTLRVLELWFEPHALDAVKNFRRLLPARRDRERFLKFAMQKDPESLGQRLSYLFDDASSEEELTLEADILAQCCQLAKPSVNELQGPDMWLSTLAKYWASRGDRSMEAKFLLLGAEAKAKRGDQGIFGFGHYAYIFASYAYADEGNFEAAAETMRKAAEADRTGIAERPFGLWYQAGELFRRAGQLDEGADAFTRAGRPIRASRLLGSQRYDVEEVRPLVELLQLDPTSVEYVRKVAAERAKDAEDADILAVGLLGELVRDRKIAWDDWAVMSAACELADAGSKRMALQRVETQLTKRGQWFVSTQVYVFHGLNDECARLCIEHDELEIAALWYEHLGNWEAAADIYSRLKPTAAKSSEGSKSDAREGVGGKSTSKDDEAAAIGTLCPRCQARVEEHWKFCPECEAPLVDQPCPGCSEPLKSHWKRCPKCGRPVST